MKTFEFCKIFTKKKNGYFICPPNYMKEFKNILDKGDGYLLIKGFPVSTKNVNALETELLKLSFTFGIPVSQSNKNNFIVRVEDIIGKNEPSTSLTRGYEYSGALPPHNDRCDLFMLVGIQASSQGGKTRLINSKIICNQLANDYPDVYEILQRDFPVDHSKFTEKQGDISSYPIISQTTEGDILFWYTRPFIENAAKFDIKNGLKKEQVRALHILDKIIEENIEAYLLQKGDVLLVNNHKTLHGRQKFLEGDKRLLYRVWLSIPNGKKLPTKYLKLFGRVQEGTYRGGVWSDQLKLTDISPNFETAQKEIKELLFANENNKRN